MSLAISPVSAVAISGHDADADAEAWVFAAGAAADGCAGF
jgi:hypothetical protein